jgi:hypothetical protein
MIINLNEGIFSFQEGYTIRLFSPYARFSPAMSREGTFQHLTL